MNHLVQHGLEQECDRLAIASGATACAIASSANVARLAGVSSS